MAHYYRTRVLVSKRKQLIHSWLKLLKFRFLLSGKSKLVVLLKPRYLVQRHSIKSMGMARTSALFFLFFSDVICYRYKIYLLIVAEVAEIQNNHKYFPQRDNFERINEVKLYLDIRSVGKLCVEFSSTSSN